MKAITVEFEGIDGSGKTTAYSYFIEKLRNAGLRVLETREVGSPHIPVCVELRKLILNPENKMDGKAMEFVFAAMRVENQKFYDSVSELYDVIVSDRGWLSHLSYTDHNVSAQFTEEFYMGVVAQYTLPPDAVIFLEIDPNVALKRRGIRNGFVDAIEAKGPEFQEKVYSSFEKYMGVIENGTAINRINANGDLDSVKAQLDGLVNTLLTERTEVLRGIETGEYVIA